MTIQKWDPFREFERLHGEVDRLFRTSAPRNLNGETETCAIPVDIAENAEEVLLKAELPGVPAVDVKVSVEDNLLTIEGEKRFSGSNTDGDNKDTFLRVERYYGRFSRSFTLPRHVDTSAIKAEHRDGILTLHLPKKAETKPRQIEIKAE